MSDIAGLLKSEISRLSKKVVRQHLEPLRSASLAQKKQIATLKLQVAQLEREMSRLRRGASKTSIKETVEPTKTRFVAKGLASLRSRLGLSAANFGLLLGVSTQTIYNWENKKAMPRAEQVAAIAKMRGIGKRAVMAKIAELTNSATAES